MSTIEKFNHTVNEKVFVYIRDAVLNGHYERGQHLVQEEIARELGVSRIPVREALHKLCAEGLVEMIPHKGATVKAFSFAELEDVYRLRALLEVEAARMVTQKFNHEIEELLLRSLEEVEECLAQHKDKAQQNRLTLANRDFHVSICRSCGSPRLLTIVSSLWNSFPRYGVALIPGQGKIVYDEHKAIFFEMKKGNENKVTELMKKHIDSSGKRFIECYKNIL